MGRGRLAMKLIETEKSRKTTFQKRKNGIMKKAHELSTLCGVDCCVIVYSPDNYRPEIWPKNHFEVDRIISKYKLKTKEKSSKKYDVMEFFKDRKNKVEAEACKLRQERLRKLYPTWDFTFDKFNEEQLRMFAALLDSKIENCKERIHMLKKKCYIKEKQQQQQVVSLASSSSRSHLSFMHNNNNNNTTRMLSANHQTLSFPLKSDDGNHRVMLHPFHPKLMPLTMISHNNDSATAATKNNDPAFSHFDVMMRESYCPSSSWCYTNDSINSSSNYPYLQNDGNNMQIQKYHHEANWLVNDTPAAPMMKQEFQTHDYGYNNQHDQLLQVLRHQKFNYIDHKK